MSPTINHDNITIEYNADQSAVQQISTFQIGVNLDLAHYFLQKISSVQIHFEPSMRNPKNVIIEKLKPIFQSDIDNICNAIKDRPIKDRAANNIFERTFGILIKMNYPIREGNLIPIQIPLIWVLLECLWDYEKRTGVIFHKGTIYHWMFEYYMSQDAIDLAYYFLNQAMEEDRRMPDSHFRDQPGYIATSLIEPIANQEYHGYWYIKEFIDNLKDILNEYNTDLHPEGHTDLSYEILKQKFLDKQDSAIEKDKITFLHSFITITHFLWHNNEELGKNNKVAGPLALDYLFNLTHLLENILFRFSNKDYLRDSIIAEFCEHGLNWEKQSVFQNIADIEYKAWKSKTTLTSMTETDFNQKMTNLVNLNFGQTNPPSKKAGYFFTVSLLRNLAGHNLIYWDSVSKNMNKLFRIIVKAFIAVVEYVYI